MNNIYLMKQGSILRSSSEQIIIEYKGAILEKIPIIYIDRVLVFGNIQVTAQAISLLLEKDIDVTFLSLRGKLKGSLCANKSKNIYVRLAQFEKFKDMNFRLKLIKEVVRNKLLNQLKVIKKYSYIYPEISLDSELFTINKIISSVDERFEINEIMGYEGAGSVAYFKFFSKIMRGDFIFEGRKMHPSPDPINAMLSLGYVMLTNELASLLESSSFDPYFGFFHGIRYGRQSLPLDIIEEFRQPFIDMFTLKLINKKIFTKKDFEVHNDGSCNFIEDSLKKYFSLYDEYMNELTKDYNLEEKSRRGFLKRQVERLSDSVLTEYGYEAFLL